MVTLNEFITNNVKILYALGFYIMEGHKPRKQMNATNKIIETFTKSVPCPYSITYMFENPNSEEYIMVEFMNDGTCAMRIPTANEMNEYIDYQIKLDEGKTNDAH